MACAIPNLSIREAQALEELLADNQDVFETGSFDHGQTESVPHRSIPATPNPFASRHADSR